MLLTQLLTPKAQARPTPGGGRDLFSAGKTRSGQSVTPESALRVAAVYSCVRVLSETLSALPLQLNMRAGRNRTEAVDHPLNNLIGLLPNEEVTSFDFRSQNMASLLLQGKAFNQVVRDRGGRVAELWPLMPDKCHLDRAKSNGKLVLVVDGEPQAWPMSKVWRIAGLTTNGIDGLTPIGMARETIGSAMAMEHYSAAIYGNGAKPGGVLEMPGKLSKEGQERLLESWNSTHGGVDNASKVALLQEGMKWQQISMSAEDAQFIESRKYNRSEVAGLFGVPPHMIGDLENATFSNIEHQGLQMVIYSLMPWICRYEQSIARDLLLPSERPLYYAKFNVNALLRGDSQARAKFYESMNRMGAYSPNDVRKLEDENPVEHGDNRFINSASITLENAANVKPQEKS